MSVSTSPSPEARLRCFSQWGPLERNDAVIIRQTGSSGLEVFLPPSDQPQPRDWVDDGYHSSEQYLFWSRRVCGLACLQSLLHGWTDVRLSMGELLAMALDAGCYVIEPAGTVRGLLYRPFMAWVSAQFGFDCQLVERTPIDISSQQVRANQVMIASVSAEIRDPDTPEPRRGGHLVLIHSVQDDVVCFHNPSGYSHNSDSATLPLHVFERFHADRGILISASR